jgi:hypothetical protein
MQQGIQRQEPVQPTEPTTSRLRTVTGSRWPRKCACGCGLQIPRDPEVRYVVDFGTAKPYPAYLREHSPDCGTYPGGRARKSPPEAERVPGLLSRPGRPGEKSPGGYPLEPPFQRQGRFSTDDLRQGFRDEFRSARSSTDEELTPSGPGETRGRSIRPVCHQAGSRAE